MAECVICSDLFDGIQEVSSIPCGHVFHSSCISEWLKRTKPPTCPECRNKCGLNQLNPVYFVVKTDESVNIGTVINDFENFNVKYTEKCAEAAKVRNKVDILRKETKVRETTIEKMIEKNAQIGNKIKKLEEKHGNKILYENKIQELQKSKADLFAEIEDLEIVRQLETCTTEELRIILNQLVHDGSSSEANKSMTAFCLALKQKLSNSVIEREKNSLELDKLKLENEKVKQKIEKQLVVLENLKKESAAKKKILTSKSVQDSSSSLNGISKNVSSTKKPNPDWCLPWDDLELQNIYVYSNGIRTFRLVNDSPQFIVRVLSSNFYVTLQSAEDKKVMGNLLMNGAVNENDPKWKTNGMILTSAFDHPNFSDSLTDDERWRTVKRKVITDYLVNFPPNYSMSTFPHSAPVDQNDPKWISAGFKLTPMPISVVIEHFSTESLYEKCMVELSAESDKRTANKLKRKLSISP